MVSTSTDTSSLAGLRVFLAEDEPMIAMLLEDTLEELGCSAVGPYDSVSNAVDAARRGDFDVALIDYNLNGIQATPLAEVLCELGRPFTIVSGTPTHVAPHGEVAILGKPFKLEDLASALAAMDQRTGTAG